MLKRLQIAINRGIRSLSPPTGNTFSSVVPAESVFAVNLEELAFVILTWIRTQRSGTTISAHQQAAQWAQSYEPSIRQRVRLRITEAWQLLVQRGLIAETKIMGIYETWFATERGQSVERPSQLPYGKRELLPQGLLIPDLVDSAEGAYLSGRYDDACAAAFKQVEITVRTLCNYPEDLVGVHLMREAFKPNLGPLSELDAPEAEQLAAANLFSGAIGYFKNPFSHRKVGISDPAQAASLILLANELIVTARRHYTQRQKATQT